MKKILLLTFLSSLAFISINTYATSSGMIKTSASIPINTNILPINNVFAPQTVNHTHGSNITYYPNGKNLYLVWFSGNGEKTGTEVRIMSSFTKASSPGSWYQPSTEVAYNGYGYPDTNPAILFNKITTTNGEQNHLQLFWEKIYNQHWQGAEVRTNNAIIKTSSIHHPKNLVWQSDLAGNTINLSLTRSQEIIFTDTIRQQQANTWPLKNGVFCPTCSELDSDAPNVSKQDEIAMFERLKQEINSRINVHNFAKVKAILLQNSDMNQFSDVLKNYSTFSSAVNQFDPSASLEEVGFNLKNFLTLLYNSWDAYVVFDMWATMFNPHSIYYHLGWETRSNPLKITKKNGGMRILLPLYSDSLNFSIVAYSDDNGVTWQLAPSAIMTRFGIQPSLVQITQTNGKKRVLAYMRNNGGMLNLTRALYSYSDDDGLYWEPSVPSINFRNYSSSLVAYKLPYGNYKDSLVVVYNLDRHRKVLAIAMSRDNGKTWKKLIIEQANGSDNESFQYPSIVQSADGFLHISFSHFYPNDLTYCHVKSSNAANSCQNIGTVSILPQKIWKQ